MFTGLVIFVAAIIFAAVKLLKMTRALFRGGGGRNDSESEAKKTPKEDARNKEKVQEEAAQVQQEKPPTLEESMEEETRSRYDAAQGSGIYEIFWKKGSELSLSGKDLADAVTSQCGMTYLEFNNRMMAGADFRGFNLLLDEGKKLTLTYYGKAIASIAKVETKVFADGKDTGKTLTLFRTNTFPPFLREGMIVADVKKMLSLRQVIAACDGHPVAVCTAMLEEFCAVDNIQKLKRDIGPKIQAKESKLAQSNGQKQPKKKL